MQIFHNLFEWIEFRKTIPSDHSLGFVPTMGNLHQGHASLYATSKKENTYTIASVFVNRVQFNKQEDFIHYPRTLDADIALLEQSGVDFCIIPEEQDIYPDAYIYQVHENNLSQIMEGRYRPGHFNGVLTVVLKLLNCTKPTNAYFGEKDYQQYLLIKEMVHAFFLGVNIKACPTIREPSGLAYSSRNNRLNSNEKILAQQFAKIFHQDKPCVIISKELEELGITVEYIEDYNGRRYAAVLIGAIRLIDNYLL